MRDDDSGEEGADCVCLCDVNLALSNGDATGMLLLMVMLSEIGDGGIEGDVDKGGEEQGEAGAEDKGDDKAGFV